MWYHLSRTLKIRNKKRRRRSDERCHRPRSRTVTKRRGGKCRPGQPYKLQVFYAFRSCCHHSCSIGLFGCFCKVSSHFRSITLRLNHPAAIVNSLWMVITAALGPLGGYEGQISNEESYWVTWSGRSDGDIITLMNTWLKVNVGNVGKKESSKYYHTSILFAPHNDQDLEPAQHLNDAGGTSFTMNGITVQSPLSLPNHQVLRWENFCTL